MLCLIEFKLKQFKQIPLINSNIKTYVDNMVNSNLASNIAKVRIQIYLFNIFIIFISIAHILTELILQYIACIMVTYNCCNNGNIIVI